MVLAKYSPKVKLENFHNFRVPELGKLCVPDLVESTDVVLAKYSPKVKLENFHNFRVPELEKLCVPCFLRALGFYSSVNPLCFSGGKIFPYRKDSNKCTYFTGFFPYKVPID